MAPAAKEARSAPFVIGEALPLVPGRAVDKILAGEYIDFSEFLPDNMELMRRDGERNMAAGWQSVRSPMRRLTSLLFWVQAHAAFAAVVLSHRPDRSTELIAYLRVLVREAQQWAEQAGERTTSNSACRPGHTHQTPGRHSRQQYAAERSGRQNTPGQRHLSCVTIASRPITQQKTARWRRQRKWFIARRKRNHLRQRSQQPLSFAGSSISERRGATTGLTVCLLTFAQKAALRGTNREPASGRSSAMSANSPARMRATRRWGIVNSSPREKGGSAVAATLAAGALGATAKPSIAAAGGRAHKATDEKE